MIFYFFIKYWFYIFTIISYKTEYVVAGDTLWSIAEQEVNNNEYYKNDDIRTVVYDIKYINNLKSSELKQGMELKIPVY